MDDFFRDFKDISAFGFAFDDDGQIVPAEDAAYQLFEGVNYPFVRFAHELCCINDYCYEVLSLVRDKMEKAEMDVKNQKNNPTAWD